MAALASSLPESFPLPRTRLIGREVERAAARSLLLEEAVPLLTVTGPGGVGKTRLAVAMAQDLAAHFADGAAFVDLAPLADPTLVATTVAATLGIPVSADHSVTAALVAQLRPEQRFLLLDNCEHVLAATAELVAALLASCPAVQVLATSRAPLRLRGEQGFPVSPLPVPATGSTQLAIVRASPAVMLFAQRARGADPHFTLTDQNAGAVAELCRRLDGLPLALELAAARVSVLAPEAMLALWHQQRPVADRGPRDAPARHQTVRAAMAWSYDLLAPSEQAVFRSLSVFAGGWSLEAAAAVCQLPLAAVLARLDALVDLSLVVRQRDGDAATPRFTMLETIRAFGLDQLQERGEDATAHDRHAAFFHGFIADLDLHHAFPGDPAWYGRVVPEEANLRQALTRFAARGQALALNDLSAALDVFWLTRSQLAEARVWLEQAIACDADLPPLVRARSRGDAGFLYWLHGDYAAAAPLLADALALARAGDDPYLLADTLIGVGYLARSQGDLGQAQAYTEEAERVARAIGPGVPNAGQLAAAALGMQAEIARLAGDTATALARGAEAIRHHHASGGTWFLRLDLSELGLTQVCAGDTLGATPHLLEALARSWRLHEAAVLTHERGEDLFVTTTLCGLAAVAATTQQPEAAARLLGATDRLDSHSPYAAYAKRRNQETTAWCLAHLRDTLDPHALEALRHLGTSLSLGQAVALAHQVATTVLGPARVEAFWRAAGAPAPGPVPALPQRHGVPRPVATSGEPGMPLTFREQEVLMLLCQRLTDGEIAQRLFLSPRTASRHVGAILRKLGAANRREAAALAARHHLV